jgi:hypothetical protein
VAVTPDERNTPVAVEFGGGDGDLCAEVGLSAGITMASTAGARAGPTEIEHREGGLHLVAESDPDFEVTLYFDIEDLVLLVGGHLVRVQTGRLRQRLKTASISGDHPGRE